MDKLVNLLPRPVFLGLVVVLGITFVFWRLETRPDALPAWGFLLNPLYIALDECCGDFMPTDPLSSLAAFPAGG